MSGYWAHGLEAGSVVYAEAQGTICVRASDREWRELVVVDGYSRTNVYMVNHYKEDHVIYAADGILAKIRALPVGHVIPLKDMALFKESDDVWARTGSNLCRTDEEVKYILHDYGVTL